MQQKRDSHQLYYQRKKRQLFCIGDSIGKGFRWSSTRPGQPLLYSWYWQGQLPLTLKGQAKPTIIFSSTSVLLRLPIQPESFRLLLRKSLQLTKMKLWSSSQLAKEARIISAGIGWFHPNKSNIMTIMIFMNYDALNALSVSQSGRVCVYQIMPDTFTAVWLCLSVFLKQPKNDRSK